MSRRREPTHISEALDGLTDRLRPQTMLARVQSVWPQAAGATLAKWADPVSERAGVVTFACSDSMVAHELEMMKPLLLEKLLELLPGTTLNELRFVIR